MQEEWKRDCDIPLRSCFHSDELIMIMRLIGWESEKVGGIYLVPLLLGSPTPPTPRCS